MAKKSIPHLDWWYAALSEDYGLFLRTSPDGLLRLKSLLYNAKARAKDPTLDRLSLRTSPRDPTTTLWIIPLPPEE